MDHIKLASALGAAAAQAKFAAENPEAAKKQKGGMSGKHKALLAALLGGGALGGGALGAHMMMDGGLGSLFGGGAGGGAGGAGGDLGGEGGGDSTPPTGGSPADLGSGGAAQMPAAVSGLPSGHKGNPAGLMEAMRQGQGGGGGQPMMPLPPGQRGQEIQGLSNVLGNPVPGQ